MIQRCAKAGCVRRAVASPTISLWAEGDTARAQKPATFELRDLGLCSPCITSGSFHDIMQRADLRLDVEALMVKKGQPKPDWASLKTQFHAIQGNDAPEFTTRRESVL